MAMNARRRYARHVKGMRRLKEDRAQHGGAQVSPYTILCECFGEDASKGRGAEFSRFADTPTPCSVPDCCGNRTGPSRQERRAATVTEWD